MNKSVIPLIIIFALLLELCSVSAETIIVNSRDWKDVYSGYQYGVFSGAQPKFLVSEKHATIILNEIPQTESILALSSKKVPYAYGYESTLKGMGYNATEIVFSSLSIELAKRLTGIHDYIILDDSYGYNAIAVAPYAALTNSYVLFADKSNINEVYNFLSAKSGLNHIIIYGNVDREVRDKLAEFNPEIINEDGDRFANNVEIVKKYKLIKDTKQVLLTNGEFIEADLMSGEYPTLFIGTNNVPDEIRNYIKSSNIEVGVLIGNELVGSATTVRRETGISTFVKFARSARTVSGPVQEVEGLDMFQLPTYTLSIQIDSVRYNSVTRQLEITMKNNVELATYFKGTYTIKYGDQQQVVGDTEAVFLEGNDLKTIVYDLDPITGDDPITLSAYVIFGESKNSLERALEQVIDVEKVEVYDDTTLIIRKVTYQKDKQQFVVQLENPGDIDVYAKTELVDVLVLDEKMTFGSTQTVKLPARSVRNSIIVPSEPLADEDFENNNIIKVRAYYGQRENALSKIVEGDFELLVSSFDLLIYLPLLVIIILLFLLILAKRRKK